MTTDADILAYNPWGDDDSDYRVLRSGMVVTRKPHECAICFETFPAGSRVRAQTEVFDGDMKTFRFCPACCEAMGKCISGEDEDGELIEQRTQIGMRVRQTLPAPEGGE